MSSGSSEKKYSSYKGLVNMGDATAPRSGVPDSQTRTEQPLADNAKAAKLLSSIISRLEALERFAAHFDQTIGTIYDSISGVNLALETTNTNLQTFAEYIIRLINKAWGILPNTSIYNKYQNNDSIRPH
ncbi:hypothetical protein F5Y16DRAFT_392489 [Xylariaceae sp. FL0255]|nr:hypothetical protein F5Y16DRAFT_392489 [Xylariaceae sp. FL0255]